MKQINIQNHKVTPYITRIGNQHEHKVDVLEFNLQDIPSGHRYLVVIDEKKTNTLIYIGENKTLDITHLLTFGGDELTCHLLVTSKEIYESEVDTESTVYISDAFLLYVDTNDIDISQLNDADVPEPLLTVYDDMLYATEKAADIYEKLKDVDATSVDIDLSDYIKKSEMPKQVDLSEYAKKSELPNLEGYALKSDIPQAQDLSEYAKKSDIPKQQDLSRYVTMDDLIEQNYVSESEVASMIRTSIGALENGTY